MSSLGVVSTPSLDNPGPPWAKLTDAVPKMHSQMIAKPAHESFLIEVMGPLAFVLSGILIEFLGLRILHRLKRRCLYLLAKILGQRQAFFTQTAK